MIRLDGNPTGNRPLPDGVVAVECDTDGAVELRRAIDDHVADGAIAWALLWLAGLDYLYLQLTREGS